MFTSNGMKTREHVCDVIQIVPRRTNRPDGIGDHGTQLARALLERANIKSIFISATPAQTEAVRADEWETRPLARHSSREIAECLSEICQTKCVCAVIVHVSGYGYQTRGAPLWLLRGMRMWRRDHRNYPIIGIFHELLLTGPVWNSSFWLSRVQKHVTRGIWKICDAGLTTTAPYFEQLTSWRPEMRDRLQKMPVFSNVGEPENIVSAAKRAKKLAVFGAAEN